jgi:nicotinate-nucleotide pyrophosphorylase (carboxylating)
VLAGLATLPDLVEIFAPGVAVECHARDGDRVASKVPVATFEGPVREILAMERPMLNLISRLSGIATRTAAFVAAMGPRVDGKPELCDTRKTTPGLRVLEKYAVRCGGGHSHRMGLFDAVLIKDNHLAGVAAADFPAAVGAAIERVMSRGVNPAFIQVEVDSLEQFRAILSATPPGLGMVLLDNLGPVILKEAVRLRDGAESFLILEASGGVTLETVRGIADSGVDRVSVGSLTHGAVSVDLGLDAC